MWPWQKKRQPRSDGPSFIGPGIRIRGRVDSEGELTISGRVEGDISHDGLLIIGPGALCISNIRAVQMRIAGEVRGNIQVQQTLELMSTARLYGDTWCEALEVENGALFFGTNHMAGATELLPAPAAAAAPAPVAPVQPEPMTEPLSILLRPIGIEEKAVLGNSEPPVMAEAPPADEPVVASAADDPAPAPASRPDRAEAPAFYGGFSGALGSGAS
jgi:cytoskeletal protein CcmA (bactofilin family)